MNTVFTLPRIFALSLLLSLLERRMTRDRKGER
mgnify:CR=1 FL=1